MVDQDILAEVERIQLISNQTMEDLSHQISLVTQEPTTQRNIDFIRTENYNNRRTLRQK